jgi:hypothetical protein
MPKKVIKINSNPNTTRAPGRRNPTAQSQYNDEYYENVVVPHFGIEDKPKQKETKKINSNPVPGRTRIGNLARGSSGRGGSGGGGGGWMDQIR